MSGRQPEELDRLFKRVPNLGLIAENGCFIKEFGYSKWKEMPDPEKMRAWQESVEGTMRYYQERTPGSWIEKRHCSLIFHYKDADDFESASRQAGDCASHINDACEKQRVRAIPVDGTVILPKPLLDQLLTRNRRSNGRTNRLVQRHGSNEDLRGSQEEHAS
jgi:trehalose 6-phosphate synthase/phosphatase